MTNKQILTKAIEKALKNGWDFMELKTDMVRWEIWTDDPSVKVFFNDGNGSVVSNDPFMWQEIIFSHDFAKAFWVLDIDYNVIPEEQEDYLDSYWQYLLQQQVISDDPIGYMEAYL